MRMEEPMYYKPLPRGYIFCPSDSRMSSYYLKRKALGQPMGERTVPGECHDIFSRHPRSFPGYWSELHWFYFCRKPSNQTIINPYCVWTPIGEKTNVLDPENNGRLVGIKRSFALIEKEKDEHKLYDWFMDEISLPNPITADVANTVWVMCHIFGKEIEPGSIADYPMLLDSDSEYDEEEETVDDNSSPQILDLLLSQQDLLPPPPPSSP